MISAVLGLPLIEPMTKVGLIESACMRQEKNGEARVLNACFWRQCAKDTAPKTRRSSIVFASWDRSFCPALPAPPPRSSPSCSPSSPLQP